jgi:hypothetical protein
MRRDHRLILRLNPDNQTIPKNDFPISLRSFNGKPQASANARTTDACGLPLNDDNRRS